MAEQIRWNDKHFQENDINNDKRGSDPKNPTMWWIGKNTIKKYLEIFNFIIRGHEDSIAHASLLGNYNTTLKKYSNNFIIGNTKQIDSSSGIVVITKKMIYNNKKIFSINPTRDENTEPQIRNGPIESIDTSNDSWKDEKDFLKVLTISTNNDIGRELDSDSFIILNFNKYPTSILNNNRVIKNQREIDTWLGSMTHTLEQLAKIINNGRAYQLRNAPEPGDNFNGRVINGNTSIKILEEFYNETHKIKYYKIRGNGVEGYINAKHVTFDVVTRKYLKYSGNKSSQEQEYHEKYLKYKDKYLSLKNKLI